MEYGTEYGTNYGMSAVPLDETSADRNGHRQWKGPVHTAVEL